MKIKQTNRNKTTSFTIVNRKLSPVYIIILENYEINESSYEKIKNKFEKNCIKIINYERKRRNMLMQGNKTTIEKEPAAMITAKNKDGSLSYKLLLINYDEMNEEENIQMLFNVWRNMEMEGEF